MEFQLQHQSFQWIFKADFFYDWLVWSLCCPRDTQESSPALQFESISSSVLSLLYGPTLHLYMITGKAIALIIWTFVSQVISRLFNMLSRLAIAFLPRSKSLLTSWLDSPSAEILEFKKIKSLTVSPSICNVVMGMEAMVLVLWMLSFKPAFSLFSCTLNKRLFSFSSFCAIRVVSSAYLRLLIFLPAILIPAVRHPAWHFS